MDDPTGTDATHPLTTPIVGTPAAALAADPTGTQAGHPATTPAVPAK